MNDLIQFLKDRIGYRKVAHPSPKEVGLPVIYNGRQCILLPFTNVPTLHQHLSDNYYDINGLEDFSADELFYDFQFARFEDSYRLRILDIPLACSVRPREACGRINYDLIFNGQKLRWALGYYRKDIFGAFTAHPKDFWELTLFCSPKRNRLTNPQPQGEMTMPTPEGLKQLLNQEELEALEAFLATKKTLTPEVLESLYEFCRRVKEVRPNAVLYCTGAKICFRTALTKKGQAFGLQPSKIAYRYDSDYFPKFDGAPQSVEGLLSRCYEFWVVFEQCDHGDVTGQDFFEKAVQAGIDAYDQCLERVKSKKKSS